VGLALATGSFFALGLGTAAVVFAVVFFVTI